MTLIDYLNRVHFGENILEEAIWAELDQRPDTVLCVMSDPQNASGELGERIRAGIPRHVRTVDCSVAGGVPTEAEARTVVEFYRRRNCQTLLAYGRGQVINLAKAVRILAGHDAPLARFADSEGGALRLTAQMPDLIAVPTMKGFSSGFNGLFSILLDDGAMIDIGSRALVPTVTIGDPTVALQEPVNVQVCAGVAAVTLCVEALLSPNFNPPANGIALDGLNRGLKSLRSVSNKPDVGRRREMLAACMNAAMVQRKGLGPVHAMTSSLCAVTRGRIDKGAVKRLLLPEILRFYTGSDPSSCDPLASAIGARSAAEAVEIIAAAFAGFSLPEGLSEMGVVPEQVADSAERAARHRALANSPNRPEADDIRNLLQSIY